MISFLLPLTQKVTCYRHPSATCYCHRGKDFGILALAGIENFLMFCPAAWSSIVYLDQHFSNIAMNQNHLEVLLKSRLLSCIPKSLIQEVWSGVSESAFLISSQKMQMLLSGDHTLRTTVLDMP